MPVNNAELIAQLETLVATLKNIAHAVTENSQDLSALAATFKQQLQQLKSFVPIKIENLTFEFCEETSEIAEQITDLRLMENPVPDLLAKNNLITAFTDCVALLKKALYQHEALAKEQEEPLLPGDSIEATTARAEAAARNSRAASLRSEKSSKMGLQLAEELKELQQRTPNGLLDPEVIERNVRHTLIMYLHNTAAVIAADESATTIAELEALLPKA